MKAYSIFDDFPADAVAVLSQVGVEVVVHPYGAARPDKVEITRILEEYDIIIIGTSQKLSEDCFANIMTHKIIGTASVGMDHINIPADKKNLITVINTPKANAKSVAEFTIGCALACIKRMNEGALLYTQKKDNKKLFQKPEDLCGKTMGVVGAGNISREIMGYAKFFGMNILCWTAHPSKHSELLLKGVQFVDLMELAEKSDVVSVNLPNNPDTVGIIDADFVEKMKENCIFISVSRLATIDWKALLKRAGEYKGFYVCLDIDIDDKVSESIKENTNVQITPHIAGGTVETRRRMFMEVATTVAKVVS